MPDLIVLGEELAASLMASGRSTITEDMPAPLLAIEVVFPGEKNEDSPKATFHERDYRFKRSEYAARGIQEYWIVDSTRAKVGVLTLVDGLYEAVDFTGSEAIRSFLFPQLNLTVEQILQVGNE
jgi:Uma2 family endonuclease